MLVEVVGEEVEIAVFTLNTAVDTTIVGVADAVEHGGIGHRKRAQQNAVHQRKDGRVGADAERQRDDRHDGEPGRLAQLAQGIAQVLKQGLHTSLHEHLYEFMGAHVPRQTVSDVGGLITEKYTTEAISSNGDPCPKLRIAVRNRTASGEGKILRANPLAPLGMT